MFLLLMVDAVLSDWIIQNDELERMSKEAARAKDYSHLGCDAVQSLLLLGSMLSVKQGDKGDDISDPLFVLVLTCFSHRGWTHQITSSKMNDVHTLTTYRSSSPSMLFHWW